MDEGHDDAVLIVSVPWIRIVTVSKKAWVSVKFTIHTIAQVDIRADVMAGPVVRL